MDVASTSTNRPRIKGCGRKRILINRIESKSKRLVTFSKRKKGLLKKAAELSMLTGDQIGVIIISEQERVYASENADVVLQHHRNMMVDDQGGFWRNPSIEIEKINDGKESLEMANECGELSQDMKKKAVARMEEENKGKNCLIDLNKAPDEQFS
ncbi:hypothetical protein DITRI_Ditri02bG0160500 [Diplodiscus trichospermus]